MKISEVQIIPVKPQNGLIAFASCVLDDCYYIGSIAVYTRLKGGYRLVFPTKLVNERQMHIHHPISRKATEEIENAVFPRLHTLLEETAEYRTHSSQDQKTS